MPSRPDATQEGRRKPAFLFQIGEAARRPWISSIPASATAPQVATPRRKAAARMDVCRLAQ